MCIETHGTTPILQVLREMPCKHLWAILGTHVFPCQSHTQQPLLLTSSVVCFWSFIDSFLKQTITYFNQPYQNQHKGLQEC